MTFYGKLEDGSEQNVKSVRSWEKLSQSTSRGHLSGSEQSWDDLKIFHYERCFGGSSKQAYAVHSRLGEDDGFEKDNVTPMAAVAVIEEDSDDSSKNGSVCHLEKVKKMTSRQSVRVAASASLEN